MKPKRKFGTVRGGGAYALKRRRDVVRTRSAKPELLVGLFAAFLVFGLAYTFTSGSYPYYSLAAALFAGFGAYEVARLRIQDKNH
jgi:ABC-type branched-subunit amino acid transport system permease subunit